MVKDMQLEWNNKVVVCYYPNEPSMLDYRGNFTKGCLCIRCDEVTSNNNDELTIRTSCQLLILLLFHKSLLMQQPVSFHQVLQIQNAKLYLLRMTNIR